MKFKRLIPFICMLLLFSMLCQTAFALETDPPADDPLDPSPYTYIAIISIDFDISSSGLTDDYCQVYIPDTSCTATLDMYLQHWNTGTSRWETVKSWSKQGVETITLEKEWYVVSGYTYRLKCAISVYDSDGLLGEVAVGYSNHYYY